MTSSPTERKGPSAHQRRARIIAQLHEQSNASVSNQFASHKVSFDLKVSNSQSRRALYWGLVAAVVAMISVTVCWRQIVG
jgi:hypothetical protein